MSQQRTAVVAATVSAACKAERRASVRLQSSAKGACQSLSLERETGWEAAIRDISGNGIGLLLSRRFEAGASLAIEIPEAARGQKHLLLARVVRATLQSDGNWLVGCTLMSPLAEDEVRLLLGTVP